MCVDLCGVDYLDFMGRSLPDGIAAERFEVVVNLLDLSNRRRTRLRVQVPEAAPIVASLFDLYPGTEAMERECFDMFGIEFAIIRTSLASSCPRTGTGIRCARTTKWAASRFSSREPTPDEYHRRR